MTQNMNINSTPLWLPFASGTLRAVQHRGTPSYARQKMEDDPIGELLGAPDPLPPMIDLSDDWATQNGTNDLAFTMKRPDQIATTLQNLTVLRLCATFGD